MLDAHFNEKSKESQQKLMGQWKDFSISQTKVDLGNTWNKGINELNQEFTIDNLKVFVTNDYPLNLVDQNLNGVIGMAPCPPEPAILKEVSFFYQIKPIVGDKIDAIKWNLTEYKNNNGESNLPGNGYIAINPHSNLSNQK